MGCHFPPGDLPHPGTEPTSPAVEAQNLNHQTIKGTSLVAQMVKNPPAMRKIWVRSLGWEILEEGMVPTPVLWPGESMDHSMGSQRVRSPGKYIAVFRVGAFGR